MTADEQDALSRFYSPATMRVLALRSGNWAIFDQSRNLLAIVGGEQVAAELFELSKLLEATIDKEPRPAHSPSPPAITLKDLGL
jgi:hypothetical protein